MKKKKMSGRKKSAAFLKKLHPADISLFLFLSILIIQSGYGILMHETDSPFDVIVRTSAASIFGYFLSGRFLGSSSGEVTEKKTTHTMYGEENGKENKENFPNSSPEKSYGKNDGEAKHPDDLTESLNEVKRENERETLQIILISSVGMVSLLFLLVMRNSGMLPLTDSALSASSQLRDFLSGSIGFLLGYPVKKE